MKKLREHILSITAVVYFLILLFLGERFFAQWEQLQTGYGNLLHPIGVSPGLPGFLMGFVFMLLALCTMLPWCSSRYRKRAFVFAVIPFLLLASSNCFENYRCVQAYKTIIQQAQTQRYEVQEITLAQLENLSEASYTIAVIGRESDADCKTVREHLREVALRQPVQFLYYDADAKDDRGTDEYTAMLEQYDVQAVPLLLVYIRGEEHQSMYFDEIITDLEPLVEYYAQQKFYFTPQTMAPLFAQDG